MANRKEEAAGLINKAFEEGRLEQIAQRYDSAGASEVLSTEGVKVIPPDLTIFLNIKGYAGWRDYSSSTNLGNLYKKVEAAFNNGNLKEKAIKKKSTEEVAESILGREADAAELKCINNFFRQKKYSAGWVSYRTEILAEHNGNGYVPKPKKERNGDNNRLGASVGRYTDPMMHKNRRKMLPE